MSTQQAATEADKPAVGRMSTRAVEGVAWAIVVFGMIVRLRQYFGARSLRYDEAVVSIEIAQRTLLQMFDMKGFIRVAPPGWFLLEKLSMMTLGTGELSVRLVPIIAGVLAMPLFWIVPRRYLGERAGLACVALAAVSPHVIFYASEVKQYSSDVLWCLLALLVIHPLLSGTASRRDWTLAGVAGAIAFWFSQPVLFVLAAGGIVLLVKTLRERREDLRHVIGLGSVWLFSLLLNYVFIIRAQMGRTLLIQYWHHGFPPPGGSAMEQLRFLNDRFYSYVDMPAGFASFGLVVFAIVTGYLAVLRRRRDLAAIIALIVAFVLIASALHMYPIDGRLMLFSVPFLLMVVGAAVAQLDEVDSWRPVRPGMILLVLMIASPLIYSARVLKHPEEKEEMRTVMDYVADRIQPDEGIYMGFSANGAYEWYSQYTDALRTPKDRTFQASDIGVGADSLRAEIEQMRKYRRIWMVFVDYYPQDLALVLEQIDPIAVREDEFSAPSALAYLYEFRPQPPDSATLRE